MSTSTHAALQYLTPPELAAELRVDVHRVLGWINSDELFAIDVSEKGSSRPRWRIAREDIERFVLRRRNGVKAPTEA